MKYIENLNAWLEQNLLERYGLTINVLYVDSKFFLSLNGDMENLICYEPITQFYEGSVIDCSEWCCVDEEFDFLLDECIPMPGVYGSFKDLLSKDSNGYFLHYDILGLTYWCLSRAEEVGHIDLDEHKRFSANQSHAYQNGYLERPIVDEWLYILGQVMKRAWPGIELKKHHFSVKVSHDVDFPSQFGFVRPMQLARRAAGALLRGHIKNTLFAPWIRANSHERIHPKDPFNSFSWIMDLSEKYNLKSAFYFICGCTDLAKDGDYEIEHPALRRLLKKIDQRGHEIGLHPSYNTFQNKAAIASEFKRLQRVCAEECIDLHQVGGRMHYLRWSHPYTLEAWCDAGLAYDSTMSYADHAGFRCGTCFEYPAINPETKEMLPLRIRPLIAMECTVMLEKYMGLGVAEDAKNKFIELAEKCRKVGGCFTMLWHNSEFGSPQKKVLYESVLSEILGSEV